MIQVIIDFDVFVLQENFVLSSPCLILFMFIVVEKNQKHIMLSQEGKKMRKKINEINRNQQINIEAVKNIDFGSGDSVFKGWDWIRKGRDINEMFSIPGFVTLLKRAKSAESNDNSKDKSGVVRHGIGYYFWDVKQIISRKKATILSKIRHSWGQKVQEDRYGYRHLIYKSNKSRPKGASKSKGIQTRKNKGKVDTEGPLSLLFRRFR